MLYNEMSLRAAIKVIEDWCNKNDIELNKKKSGIIVLNNHEELKAIVIEGIPVVKSYKYLGVLIDDKLKIDKHITEIEEKVKTYFIRYNWLKKRYFTPSCLMVLIEYFIKSRLLYGMCLFMWTRKVLSRLDGTLMKHIEKMFNLPGNTSHDRLRIILGEPNVEYRLAIRLLKIYHKYRKHFGADPIRFRGVLLKYFEESVLDSNNVDYDELGKELTHN
jgi:hypothetical protein